MFIGRKKELNVLEGEFHKKRFAFTVLYGRRRIGKTELLKRYIEDKNAIYYMAVESTHTTNLELMSKAMHLHSGKSDTYAPFQSYMALFDALTQLSKKDRLIFVIDEYPYLAQTYPEISSLIQQYCDHQWKDTLLHLILCGSSMSFMESQVLGTKSPLYGRRTTQIRLKEFTFFETEEMLQPMDRESIAVLHCATGGVAEYLTHVDRKRSIEENLLDLFFMDSGRLYEEPMNFLKQELREPKLYNSILDAMARGASKSSEIASKVGIQSGAINKYLENLMELGIIKREIPVGGGSNRKAIYRIQDGSFRFWYRYVFPNKSPIELGLGERLLGEYVMKDLSNYMGTGFEDIFIDFFDRLNQEGRFPALISQRGRWWGNNKQKKREEEIDLVGIGEGAVVFAEVKWNKEPLDVKVLEGLMEKSTLVPTAKRFFVLFARNGFKKNAMEFAAEHSNIMLLSFVSQEGEK